MSQERKKIRVEIVNRNWEPFPKGRIQQVPRKDNAAEDSCKLNGKEVMQECRKVKSGKGSTTHSNLSTR
jgi:hypothetical protein